MKISRDELNRIIEAHRINREKYPLLLIGIRGYASLGGNTGNKRNIYDDGIVILTDRVCEVFPANTDPSRFGINPKIGKGFASLKLGAYPSYIFDTHNGSRPHPAICQRVGEVTVLRDGGIEESGYFGINIHRGGEAGTSSDGCQTLPRAQWNLFYKLAKSEAQRLWGDAWDKKTICYIIC